MSPTGSFSAIADRVFRDGLMQARLNGFRGLRVVTDVSWALAIEDGINRLIAYEAHARAAFAAGPLMGLCLYQRRRLPSPALSGALLTHPLTVAAHGEASANLFYDAAATAPPTALDRDNHLKTARTDRAHATTTTT